jgi:hypothetical protein
MVRVPARRRAPDPLANLLALAVGAAAVGAVDELTVRKLRVIEREETKA